MDRGRRYTRRHSRSFDEDGDMEAGARAAGSTGRDLLLNRKPTRARGSSMNDYDDHRKSAKAAPTYWRRPFLPWRIAAFLLCLGFLLGYYAQLLVFKVRVTMAFQGEVLETRDVKLADLLMENMRRVVFVCKHTNWDYIGLIGTPHTILFAHEDVYIPPAIGSSLHVVRHKGVDSFLNLHNKTLTIMSHIHKADPKNHMMKQDDEVVMFWPHMYSCLKKCRNLSNCYAGDMHVNIGTIANTNSYVFATGGSYFVGNNLLACLLASPAYVELDGLDYGEDKTVGKMIHYNKCEVEYVSCKWFNNKEIYSPNAHVTTRKSFSMEITPDTVLLSREEQEEAMKKIKRKLKPVD